MIIDLEEHRTPGVSVLSGRDRGKKVRQSKRLDTLDEGEEITIKIPKDIYVIASSFLLGMLGPSIRKLGRENFLEKFTFVGTIDDTMINDAIREALHRKSPLSQ